MAEPTSPSDRTRTATHDEDSKIQFVVHTYTHRSLLETFGTNKVYNVYRWVTQKGQSKNSSRTKDKRKKIAFQNSSKIAGGPSLRVWSLATHLELHTKCAVSLIDAGEVEGISLLPLASLPPCLLLLLPSLLFRLLLTRPSLCFSDLC